MGSRASINTPSILFIICSLLIGAGLGYYYKASTYKPEFIGLESEIMKLQSQVTDLETLNSNLTTQMMDLETLYSNLESQMQDLETINNNIRSALALYAWNPTLYAQELPGAPAYMAIISQEHGTEAIVGRPSEIKPEHLQLNRYYKLEFVGVEQVGGDLLGFVVAMHINGYGFLVDFENQEHVSYLFESIDTPEEALELVQLAWHRSKRSAYGRDYTEITSNDMYKTIVDEMNASCVSHGEKLDVNYLPPVNFTQVSIIEDGFCVERVYLVRSGRERIEYLKVYVYSDGSTLEDGWFVCITGEFGMYF